MKSRSKYKLMYIWDWFIKHKGLLFLLFSFFVFIPLIVGSSPIEEGHSIWKNEYTIWIVGGIFIVLYAILLSNKISSALVTMFGALLFVLLGFVPFNMATEAVDWNTLSLLSGMMILVGILKFTGLFQFIALKIVKVFKGKLQYIFIGFCFTTAVMSAFLDNVTTILIIAPITMLLTDTLKISPVPFLISEAICANTGGTATLIGDPPNILIGLLPD